MPIKYKNYSLESGFRADLIVEEFLLLELKSVEQINKLHEAQILTYMKLANLPLGLILNFNVTFLRDGIGRYKF